MALLSVDGKIPKNAVVLSREEAVAYQWNQINTWPKKSDVWIYRWGPTTLGALAGAAAWYINTRYRRKLKLRNYGYVITSIPSMGGPVIFCILSHIQGVIKDLFLNQTKCSVCLQQKAAGLQIMSSILYPALVSPILNFYMASSHATYNVPYWKDGKGTLALWWKLTKPLGKPLLVIACGQAVAATYVTYMEAQTLYKLKIKLMHKSENTAIQRTENVTVKQ